MANRAGGAYLRNIVLMLELKGDATIQEIQPIPIMEAEGYGSHFQILIPSFPALEGNPMDLGPWRELITMEITLLEILDGQPEGISN